jgi:serine/threonine protein kinase
MFDSIKLSQIPDNHCGILRKPSNTRPSIWIIQENGIRAVIKDFSTTGFLYRNSIGRLLIWRESTAYKRLKGLKGVPSFYGTVNGLALILEEIPGNDLEMIKDKKSLSKDFYQELRNLVESIHQRGLIHGDLKRAPNILLSDNGKPYIVDWASSISKWEFGFFPFNRIYQRLIQADFNAIVKIQLKHCPETISAKEKRRYARITPSEKAFRTLWDKIGKKILKKIA